MTEGLFGALIALLVPVCFGTGMVVVRIGLQHMPPNTGNFLSLVSGWLVVTLLAFAIYPSQMLDMKWIALFGFALIGFINFPVGRFFNFVSIKQLGVLKAAPILAAAPVVSTAEGIFFLNENANGVILIGTLISIAGVVVVIRGDTRTTEPPTIDIVNEGTSSNFIKRHPILIGYLAAIGACLAYGTIPPLGRVAVAELAEPIVTASYTLLFGSIFMGLLASKNIPRDLKSAPLFSSGLVALSGILMGLGVSILYFALSKAPVVVVSPVFGLNVFVSMIIVRLFLQKLEKVNAQLVLGSLLVVGGVAAVIVGSQI